MDEENYMIKTPEPQHDRLHQVVTPYARANARLYSKKSKGNFPREYHVVSTAKAKQAKETKLLVYGFKLKTEKLEKIK